MTFSSLQAQISEAEGFYVNGSIDGKTYKMEFHNGLNTVYHRIDTFRRSTQSFVELARLDSPGTVGVQTYSLPLSLVDNNDMILRVYRETKEPVESNPGEFNTIQEFTYLYPKYEMPAQMAEGVALVLVDYTVYPEIADQLEGDYARLLRAEGYEPWIRKGPRAEEFDAKAVQVTKSLIREVYEESDGRLRTVFLIGRIPHPYSGNYTVDGHPDHVGAWVADTYYADINKEWNDFSEDVEIAKWDRMHNVPGDGKFDHFVVPDSIELQIGRVDFYDLPWFSETEIELYKRYIQKVIDYKSGKWDDPTIEPGKLNAIHEDLFNIYGPGFPGFTVRSLLGTMLGGDNLDYTFFRDNIRNNVYDFAYGGSSGGGASLHLLNYTEDYAQFPHYNRFTQFFGSYLCDIGFDNNLMRASIASEGQTLTCNFGGRPFWIISDMANGATIGDAYHTTINNRREEFKGYGNYFYSGVHVLLLGDPTLRAGMFAGPSFSLPPNESGDYSLKSDYDSDEYHIFRYDTQIDAYTLIEKCPDLTCAESFTQIDGLMIKAVHRIENNFGTHYRYSAPLFFPEAVGSVNPADQDNLSYENDILFWRGSELPFSEMTIEIYSIEGRLVKSLNTNSHALLSGEPLQLSQQGQGIYNLIVSSGDVKLHKKICVIE